MAKNTQNAAANTSAPKPVASPNQESGQLVDKTDTASGESGSVSPVALIGDTATAAIAGHTVKGKGTRKGFLHQATVTVDEKAVAKMDLFGRVKQGFAMVADLERGSDEQRKQAKEEADRLAGELYQARINGLAEADEVSTVLGDAFGYKPIKGDKPGEFKPGKTPNGLGEAVRKRIVRAVKAAEYVADPDRSDDRFFEGLDPKAVEAKLHQLNGGTRSLWTVYEDFAKLKADNRVRVELAFDTAKIAGMVKALGEKGAVALVAENKALQTAYASLYQMIEIIDEAVANGEETLGGEQSEAA